MAGIAASSYSDALFELAAEENKLDLIKEQLCFVDAQLQKSQKFRYVLTHPKIHKEEKKQSIQAVFGRQVDLLMLHFLQLLIDKGRFCALHEISREFMNRYRKEKNIVIADLYSAVPLDDEAEQRIRRLLEQKLNQQVELHKHVDSDLLAGIRVKVNDLVLDYTAWNKMEHLKRLAAHADQRKESECERDEFKSGRNQ